MFYQHIISNQRLWIGFGISLLLHALLVVPLLLTLSAPLSKPWGNTELVINLQVPVSNKHARKMAHTQKKSVARSTRQPLATTLRAAEKKSNDNTLAAKNASPNRKQRHNHLLGQLRTSLSQYLVYPPLARRHGWQGMVTVGLNIDSAGLLNQIRIAKSSGYAVLDSSALKSLHKVKKLDNKLFQSDRPHKMTLRVVYQLTGSGYGTSAF